MKECGLMTKQKDKEIIRILTEHYMRVHGRKINNMAMEKSLGLMELIMKESIYMEKSMEEVLSNGLMELLLQEISLTIILTEKENINGLI